MALNWQARHLDPLAPAQPPLEVRAEQAPAHLRHHSPVSVMTLNLQCPSI